jgi:hypothetical protein
MSASKDKGFPVKLVVVRTPSDGKVSKKKALGSAEYEALSRLLQDEFYVPAKEVGAIVNLIKLARLCFGGDGEQTDGAPRTGRRKA